MEKSNKIALSIVGIFVGVVLIFSSAPTIFKMLGAMFDSLSKIDLVKEESSGRASEITPTQLCYLNNTITDIQRNSINYYVEWSGEIENVYKDYIITIRVEGVDQEGKPEHKKVLVSSFNNCCSRPTNRLSKGDVVIITGNLAHVFNGVGGWIEDEEEQTYLVDFHVRGGKIFDGYK